MKTKDMTSGNELKLIFMFSLPLMFGNIFQQLYIVCDTMIVSRQLGVNALAAIGSADWLNWMGLSMVTGLAQGFCIPVSHAFGRKNKDDVQNSIFISVVCGFFSTFVLVAVLILCLKPALMALQTPAAAFSMAYSYSKILMAGLVVTMFYNILASILRSMGNSKIPLVAMLIASLTNVGLDVLFVTQWNWGIEGAAIATVLAQCIAGLFCLFYLMKLKEWLPRHFVFDQSSYVEPLKLGLPLAFQNALISIGGMIVTRSVNQFSTSFLAGFTAMNKLYGLLEISAVSYGYAMITYTGQNYGAKKYDRIQTGVKKLGILSLGTSLFLMVLLYVCGPFLLSLFLDSSSQAAQETMSYGLHFLRWLTFGMPILYALHMYRSTIQGLSDAFIPMLSGVFELVMRVIGALILPIFFGKEGLYSVEVLAWIGACCILVPTYYYKESRFPK